MINRLITNNVLKVLSDKKAIILLGPRQVGKSTLLNQQLNNKFKKPVLWLNGDETDVREQFEKTTSSKLKKMIGKSKTLIIDEAQRIPNIGIAIKLIIDNIPDVKVIATGSSSFELSNNINEPLTGRKWEYNMFPLSFEEMSLHHGLLEEKRLLEHRLVYGYYPDVVNAKGNEAQLVKQLADSYLYKDILTWERLKKPEKLEKLTQALALQVGNEVSYHELGQITGLDNETVEKYIQLLEKAFIVFRLISFSRNIRNELKKSRKIYFYDNGLRNAVINQFNAINLRNDKGALWENFIISERRKFLAYSLKNANTFFWRTHTQQEIDYIEEYGGKINAYEIKWNKNAKFKMPKSFAENYDLGEQGIITPDNFEDFITNLQ